LPFLPLFDPGIGIGFPLNAAFKPICAPRPLDVWRYGRQKRQRSGKIAARNGKDVATDGKVDGKNGNVWWRRGYIHATMLAAAHAPNWRCLAFSGGVQAHAARGGAAAVELKYHKPGRVSRA
jgi:hypothetical protein